MTPVRPIICDMDKLEKTHLALVNDDLADTIIELDAEVKDLQKKLDSLREFCHKEDYDIYDWEVKNIEVIE